MSVFDLDVIVAMAEREGVSLYEAEARLAQLINAQSLRGEVHSDGNVARVLCSERTRLRALACEEVL